MNVNQLRSGGSLSGVSLAALLMTALLLAACGAAMPIQAAPSRPIPAVVPDLPFADGYDPSLCGIPEPYGDPAPHTVTGTVDGVEIQPIVYLYDSHLRREIIGQIYPGTQVEVQYTQINPLLTYYLVRTIHVEPVQSGWLPAPFLVQPEKQ